MKVLWACAELDLEFEREDIGGGTAGMIPRISSGSTQTDWSR